VEKRTSIGARAAKDREETELIPQPPLIVYNRSSSGVDDFKSYAKDNQVEEGHYVFVEDVKEIGEK